LRRIELATEQTMLDDLESIKKSYEKLYEIQIDVYARSVLTTDIYPTEFALEEDKLVLVFKKAIEEDYSPPIIVAEGVSGYYVLDGHHRAYMRLKLSQPYMKARVLVFPQERPFRERKSRRLGDMPVMKVGPIDDPTVATWNQILTLLHYYERLYGIPFTLREAYIPLTQLVPTQTTVSLSRVLGVRAIKVPIACLETDDVYPILDGHARAVAARQEGSQSIHAMVLVASRPTRFGIVATAEKIGLKTLEDIRTTNP
jgi:hypothetical protein